ncbi:MAG: CPBP family intramembrane metalloprotease [Armatimonadetes bacterium]|jgi:hypothetical protein|nr:CPBP family intramembrane metalloprotease [Armatimonadota bacterium]
MKELARRNTIKAVVVLAYCALALPYVRSGIPRAYTYDRYLAVNYAVLFFIPLLIVLMGFGEAPEEYGLSKGDARGARRLFLLLYLPTLVGLVIAARWPVFQNYYPVNAAARVSHGELLFWEVAYNGLYMFCWEFFFRGFLLFGLRPALGNGALHLQAILFGVMHWGKPMPEFYASFLTGYVLGFVSLRTRSFLPTFGLHAACAISFDLLVLAWGGKL